MRAITSLVPIPRKVRLGDRDFLISEFRILDLARLQAWLDARVPSPLDEIRPRLLDLPTKERRQLLREAHAKAEAWPPIAGDAAAAPFMDSADGICEMLRISLSRRHREFRGRARGTPRAFLVAASMTAGQFGAFRAAAFGVEPCREIERMLGFDGPNCGKIDWHRAIDDVARTHGYTYPQIYSMSLGEFANARSGGAEPESGTSLREGETMAQLRGRVLARWNSDED